MSSVNSIQPPATPHEVFARRTTVLGVPLWRCDGDGTIVVTPHDPPALSGLSECPRIRQRVSEIARDALAGAEMLVVEALPGLWLAPVVERLGVRRVGVMVGMIIENRARADAELSAAIGDWGPAEPFIRYGQAKVEQLAEVLRWTWQDVVAGERDRQTLDQFSEKLSQAYEETNLLFHMAGMINYHGDPEQVIREIGRRSLEILPFQWLAIRFRRSASGPFLRALAGKVLLAGQVPVDQAVFDGLSEAIVEGSAAERWQSVLAPGQSELAARVGSQVLCEPVGCGQSLIGVVLAGNKSGDDADLASGEMRFVQAMARFLGVYYQNLARFAELRQLFEGTLGSLVASIDAKDPYTRGHSERVALSARQMAEKLGLPPEQVEEYRIAGTVHDVGKIGVPEAVLCKTGRLDPAEFALIKKHPEIGYHILKDIPGLAAVLPGVLHHHERWDGAGYPHGLAGRATPPVARVLALCDTFDAMRSHRAYRPAVTAVQALQEISRCAGTQFDPELAPIFLKLDLTHFEGMLDRNAPAVAA